MSAAEIFAHRDFRRVMGAKLCSVIGGQMQAVAIGWHVLSLTGRPLDLGLVGLAQFAPAALLSLVAGQVADRVDRKRILIAYHLGTVLCAIALVAIARGPSRDPGAIYLVAMALGVLRTFAGPANQALLPNLVPPEHFPRAVAWSSSVWQIAAIAGPALGGGLFALGELAVGTGFPLLYGVVAALAFAALLQISTIRVRTTIERKAVSFSTVVAGVRYVFANKIVLGSISLDLFAVLFGGAVALLPIYARDILHVGPIGLGALRSAPAVGAALVALVVAYRPIGRRLGPILFSSVALFGLATIVFGVSRSFVLSLVALAVVGAADMISVVIRQLAVQLATPDEMRGRVSAVNLVFVGASNELGEFESGVTAAWFGVEAAVVIGGLGTLLVVGSWVFLFPQLRRLDRLEELRT
jgi:MFS family permease